MDRLPSALVYAVEVKTGRNEPARVLSLLESPKKWIPVEIADRHPLFFDNPAYLSAQIFGGDYRHDHLSHEHTVTSTCAGGMNVLDWRFRFEPFIMFKCHQETGSKLQDAATA